MNSNIPDIISDNNINNPSIISPNAYSSISFGMDREQTYDYEEYKSMIYSSVREFRKSQTYSHYKAYLMNMGLNRCMFHPHIHNPTEEDQVATLEMHHCPITIHEIAYLISNHYINSGNILTEFDLSELLRIEHIENRVGVVMLCKTCHQLYHHSYLYIHPLQIFGKWWELLYKYPLGVSDDLKRKLLYYIDNSIDNKYEKKKEDNEKLLKLREKVVDWSNKI